MCPRTSLRSRGRATIAMVTASSHRLPFFRPGQLRSWNGPRSTQAFAVDSKSRDGTELTMMTAKGPARMENAGRKRRSAILASASRLLLLPLLASGSEADRPASECTCRITARHRASTCPTRCCGKARRNWRTPRTRPCRWPTRTSRPLSISIWRSKMELVRKYAYSVNPLTWSATGPGGVGAAAPANYQNFFAP